MMEGTEMRVTFLGTGASIGVPVVGCPCEVCQSNDPRNFRTRCSIYVETDELSWVVDTPQEFRLQCLREEITELDAALFTHEHSDHVLGFDDLRRFTLGDEGRLPVYATRPTMERLKAIFAYAFDQSNWFAVYVKPVETLIDGPFELGPFVVEPLPVRHGRVPTIGFLFRQGTRKRLAYVPDVKEFVAPAEELLHGVEALIIDGTSTKELPTHFSISEALEVIARVGARQSWITHVGHDIDHQRVEGNLPAHVRIAYDGLKLRLV